MKIESIILNTSIIMMPLMIYLLYTAYTKTINKKENNLILIVTIITMNYLILKYARPLYKNIPLFIINIPLLIAYRKKANILVLVTSLITCIYYAKYYNPLISILEYFIYYIIYKKTDKYMIVITIIKTLVILIISETLKTLTIGIIMYIIVKLVIYILEKAEDMLKLHMTIKEIKENEQINTSLFKITHEIKNPIAVCKGYLDMYDENKIDDFKKNIPVLKEEIDRTLILLEDFLAMNRLKINKDILDINLLLEDAIKNMNIIFAQNNIKVNAKIDEDEIYINGDYNRLMQVIINILKNSCEALEKTNNPKINIETIVDDDITIYIKDNGCGIPKKLIKKIKEPFFTTKIKGTGLGVSLSEEIINAHNGKIEYESEEGKYTTVEIKLPIEKAI